MTFVLSLCVAGLIVIVVVEGMALLCTGFALKEKDRKIIELQMSTARLEPAVDEFSKDQKVVNQTSLHGYRLNKSRSNDSTVEDDEWPSIIE